MEIVKNKIFELIILFIFSFNNFYAQNYTWVKGNTNFSNYPSVYGTKGVAAVANNPGTREGASTWTDKSGNLWLFGGTGFATSVSNEGRLSDLWMYNISTNLWTWISGPNTLNQTTVFGTQGIPSSLNSPGARTNATSWVDTLGDFWLFGGLYRNDLWKYNITTNEWTWIKGNAIPNQAGVYGTHGIEAVANTPTGRIGAVGWTDLSGNLWLFGGASQETGPAGIFCDLWRYNPVTNQWACMKGNNALDDLGIYGTLGVGSSANHPGGRYYASSWVDNSGNLWLFGGDGIDASHTDGVARRLNDLWKYDISSNNWTWINGAYYAQQGEVYGTQGIFSPANRPGARFSATSWTDISGNFWLFGGHGYSGNGYGRQNELWKYNPNINQWALIKGSITPDQPGVYGTLGVSAPTNVPGSRRDVMSWKDNAGDFWIYGGNTGNVDVLQYRFSDLWKYNPVIDAASLKFDGVNDYVQRPLFDSATNNITLQIRLNWTGQSSPNNMLVYNGNSSNTGYGIFIDPSTNSTYVLYGGVAVHDVNYIITPNVWTSLTMVIEANKLSFYADGVLTSILNVANPTNPIAVNKFSIGSNHFGSENFNGKIDDIRFWSRALCSDEIASRINCQITGSEQGLLAYYNFNQGIDKANNATINSLNDLSPNAKNCTLNNFSLNGASSNWLYLNGVLQNYCSAYIPPSPLLSANGPTSFCEGESVTLSTITNANSYSWNTGANTTTINATSTNTYVLSATNPNGCIGVSSASIYVKVNPSPTITVNSGTICSGQSFTMNPMGALTYTYSNGANVVFPITDVTYSVSGTDINGCISSVNAVSLITVNPLPIVTVNSGTICSGNSFTIIPAGAITYTFSGGTNVVIPISDATYSVTGTDANGCVSSVNAISNVTVNALPTISVNSGTICAGQSFTIIPTGALTYSYSNGTSVVTPTADATYSVSGTDTNGCASSTNAISNVIVNVLPTIIASTTNTLLCSGESSTLSVTGVTSYTWSTSDNTPDIVVTPTISTTYSVDGTDSNGCTNSTSIMQDVSLCTGIIKLSGFEAVMISVYPNPNNGLFTIDIKELSEVKVTNALGQIIITEMIEAGKHNLNIQNQSSGVYFMKVIQQDKQDIIKLIKE